MPRIHTLYICACLLAVSSGAFAQGAHSSGAILAEYQKLRDGGCKVQEFNIYTPLEARVLRNVPFALAGRKLSSPDLHDLFQRDGDWYRPATTEGVTLSNADGSCVAKLHQREKQLRRSWKVSKAIEQVVTRHPTVFLSLRRNASPGARYRKFRGRASENEWSIGFTDVAACGGSGTPEEAGDCSSVQILCTRPEGSQDWKTLTCEVIVAG